MGAGSLIGTIPPPANDGPGLGDEISYSPVTGLLGIGSSGSDGTFPGVRFWAAPSGRVVSTLQYPGTAGVNAIAYDPVDGGPWLIPHPVRLPAVGAESADGAKPRVRSGGGF